MKSRSVRQLYGCLIVAFLLACAGYGIAWPIYSTCSVHSETVAADAEPASVWANNEFQQALSVNIRMRLLELFGVFWLFAIGASFGSFMNVVVYRLPLGRTLVGRSFCPRCDQAIHALDNIPVLGWLRLGGNCRSCQLPISSRYPLVELLAGVLFLALAIVELVLGGVNLPLDSPAANWGFIELVTTPDSLLLAVFPYHAVLVLVLLTGALIEYDGHPFPPSLFVFGLIVGGLVVLFPWLHIEPWIANGEWSKASPASLPAVVEFAVSLLAAFVLGYTATALISILRFEKRQSVATIEDDQVEPVKAKVHNTVSFQSPLRIVNPQWETRPTPPLNTHSILAPVMLAGLFLGWGSLVWILAGAFVFRLASMVAISLLRLKRPIPAAADIFGGTIIFLFGWRWFASLDEQFAADTLLWLAPVAVVVFMIAYALLVTACRDRT